MFIRGGIDSTVVRPICQNDVDAETSQCALSIQVSPNYKDYKSKFSKITWFDVTFFLKTNSLGNGSPWASYDAWRVGDSKLDWFGAQAGQGTYMGITAFGTPLGWTTNNPANPAYQPLNK